MKKKVILKSNGKEVKLGDIITIHRECHGIYGSMSEECTLTITSENFGILLRDGILSIEIVDGQNEPTIKSCIEAFASKTGWTYDKAANYISKLSSIYKPAAFAILLKILAKRFDKKYTDHISEAKELWVVSLINGSVCPMQKSLVKNYDNFAAFRSKEDAELALKVLAPFVKSMYGE